MENVIEVKHLNKSFGTHEVLKDIDFSVSKGEVVCIIGSSGSGKSTILNIIGLLDKATSGDVILFEQKNIRPFSMKAEQMLKNKIGYLFQNFALIENETVANNLKLALENVRGNKKRENQCCIKRSRSRRL